MWRLDNKNMNRNKENKIAPELPRVIGRVVDAEDITDEDGKTKLVWGDYDLPAQIIVHPENPVYASENGKLIEK